ncbi:hypothetical protein, partial [Acidihalobacter prosperus]
MPSGNQTSSQLNSKTLSVTYSPKNIGAHATFLSIHSNDPDMPIIDIELRGEATENVSGSGNEDDAGGGSDG